MSALPAILGLCAGLWMGGSAAAQFGDPRVVAPQAGRDANADHVDDALEVKIATGTLIGPGPSDALSVGPGLLALPAEPGRRAYADLLVGLNRPPDRADGQQMAALGGKTVRAWHRLIFCVNLRLPEAAVTAGAVQAIAALPQVTWVEENRPGHLCLFYSTRQTRARSCWTRSSAVDGAADIRLAVCDTGLDGAYIGSAHTDLSGKIAAWYDAYYAVNGGTDHTSAVDKNGHGSHVAGVVAGTGAAAGIATGDGLLRRTHSAYFYDTSGYVWDVPAARMPVDTTGLSGNSDISSSTYWSFSAANSVIASLWNDNFPSGELEWEWAYHDATQPLNVDYPYLAGNIQNFRYIGSPYPQLDNAGDCWYVSQNACHQVAIGDGYNLNAGVAPACSLVGVKVTDEYGGASSTAAELIEGLDWILTNRQTHKIVAVNISMGYGTGVSASLDATVNNLVANGVVCVVSAGNDRGAAYISSPGTAADAITVAAINETGQITNYSSAGGGGSGKPDVAAPGGSDETDRDITSVDTGDAEYVKNYGSGSDYISSTERFANDYTGMVGTSIAAAHVTGMVGLIVDALGGISSWDWSQSQARVVKSIICMTATETNQNAEATPDPTLDRATGGGKDTCEGYGRVNADAAVSAVLDEMVIAADGTATATTTLNSDPTGRKCWARYCRLRRDSAYSFTMTVPTGCDADLYLYDDAPGSNGDPVTVQSSTNIGSGADEQFTRPVVNLADSSLDTYYLVAKLVSGSGEFTINGIGITPAHVSNFRADLRGGRPLLRWEVAEGGAVAGFNVFHAQDPKGTWEKCNGSLIVSQDGRVTWRPPMWLRTGPRGYFRLQSVDLHGMKTDHGFVEIHVPGEM